MSNRTYGIILIVVGVLIVTTIFLSIPLHLAPNPGFGYKKITGVVVGVVVFALGLFLSLRKRRTPK